MERLNKKEFEVFRELIYEESGINLTEQKKILLEGRLQKRLQSLNLSSFEEYFNLISSKQGETEKVLMLDAVSTNKTDFYREPHHFEFLSHTIVPQFITKQNNRPFKVWCAASSTGEEPYTIAITLEELKEKFHFSYTLEASDISTKVLQHAITGIYDRQRVAPIPERLLKKYFLKNKDNSKPLVRVQETLRKKINYQRINLMEVPYPFSKQKVDVIFCRNVLIYFDKITQHKVVSHLTDCLHPNGYLLIGHSESLFQMDLPLKQIHPATFQKM
ncbi:MAG: CheR family methyltransferase [Chryseotalea sp.]